MNPLTLQEIANGLRVHRTSAVRRAQKESWPFVEIEANGGKTKVFPLDTLPIDVQLAIVNKDLEEIQPGESEQHSPVSVPNAPSLNDKEKQKALLKADILRLYHRALAAAPWGDKLAARERFIATYNAGLTWPNLYKAIGPLSWKTLEQWTVKIKKNGNDCFHLADRRGRHLRGSSKLSAEQTDIVLRCILRPNKPPIAEAVRMARAVMTQKGIADGHSEATYRRWIHNWRDRNYHTWVFVREGAKAWTDECAHYIERDYDAIEVGDIVVADGHNLNFEILNPWTGKRQNHMTLILFYDMKSNMPLGWELMPTENTAAISSALRRAVIRLGKYPRVVYLDNGRAFKARFFKGSQDFEEAGYSGLYSRMGCETIYAWPYHGQSKTVERFFGTFAELERMNALSYTGTSIDNKPPRLQRGEKLHRKLHEKQFGDRCLTMAEAHRAIAAWFDIYASRKQQAGHLKNKSPMEIFMAGRGPGVNRAELTWLMMSIEVKTIHRNGITFQGQNYYHPALYGRRHPVTVRYDLQDTSSLWIFDQQGELICEATPTEKLHPAAGQLGTEEDKQKLRRHIEYKRSQEKEAAASARALLESEILPEHRRQMASLGVDADGKQIAAPSPKLISLDAEKVRRQVEEQERWQKEAEEKDFNDMLEALSDSDRMEKLLELEAQGVELSPRWTAFMSFFSETPAYTDYQEFWEQKRMAFSLMWRNDAGEVCG